MRTLVLALVAVAALATAATAVQDWPAPIVSMGLDEDGNPLRGTIRLNTQTDSDAMVTVTGPDVRIRVRVPDPATGTTEVPLLGLAPDTTYTVTATVDGRQGTTELRSGALPDFFPPIELLSSRPVGGTDDVDLTLMDVRFWFAPPGRAAEGSGYAVAVDRTGTPRWYLRTPLNQEDAQRTSDGTVLFIYDEGSIREYSVTGELLNEWAGEVPRIRVPRDAHGDPRVSEDAIPVAVDLMHHAVTVLPDGDFLTLSREVRTIDGFPRPLCGEDPGNFDGSYDIGSDVVVEIDRETGQVLRSWSIFDHASPLDDLKEIEPVHFCGGYLNRHYPERAPIRDWTHANAAAYDEERDLVLVSLRHLNEIWAFRYPSGELAWRLGEDGDFTLTQGEWFYYQHAPEVQPDGSLLIYDNGAHRPGTDLDPAGGDLPYTRAVIYELDLEAMTARQVWEHRMSSRDGDPLFAPFLGDADRIGPNRVLVNHGGAVEPHSWSAVSEDVLQYARIVEVDKRDGDIVWDLMIRDDDGSTGWSVYRADRIERLYPPAYEVEVTRP